MEALLAEFGGATGVEVGGAEGGAGKGLANAESHIISMTSAPPPSSLRFALDRN